MDLDFVDFSVDKIFEGNMEEFLFDLPVCKMGGVCWFVFIFFSSKFDKK